MNLIHVLEPEEFISMRSIRGDSQKFEVLPNGVYRIPLKWIIEDQHIMYLANDNRKMTYYPLFDNLFKKVFVDIKKDLETEKPIYNFGNELKFL